MISIREEVIERLTRPKGPTIEGERRYAAAGQEKAGWFHGRPCTCTTLCRDDCDGRGECGCPACSELARWEGRA